MVADWRVLVTKPLVTEAAGTLEYRWTRMDWPHAEVEPMALQADWAVNRPGTCRVTVDARRWQDVWDQTDFDPGGSGVRYIVPESTTLWLIRDGRPVWAGFLRDIAADPTQSDAIDFIGEEFTGQFDDLALESDYAAASTQVDTLAATLVAQEPGAAWMHTYTVGTFTGLNYTPAWAAADNLRLSELVARLASVGAGFEWQQAMRPRASDARMEARLMLATPTLGADLTADPGRHITWGHGTSGTADSISYSVSTRATRTRWKVQGSTTSETWEYVGPLGVPRRDGFVSESELPDADIETVAKRYLRTFGLPQLTARATLTVGDRWSWLWNDVDVGGYSPAGSLFRVRVHHAGFEYSQISRASVWGVEVSPDGGERCVVDLVPDVSDISPSYSQVT